MWCALCRCWVLTDCDHCMHLHSIILGVFDDRVTMMIQLI